MFVDILKYILIISLVVFFVGALIKIIISVKEVKKVYYLNKDDQYKIRAEMKSKFITFKVYEPDEDLNSRIFLLTGKYIKFENGQIIFKDMADEDILMLMTLISNYNFLLLWLSLSDQKKKEFLENDNKVTDFIWEHAQDIMMNTPEFKNLVADVYSKAFDEQISEKVNLQMKFK